MKSMSIGPVCQFEQCSCWGLELILWVAFSPQCHPALVSRVGNVELTRRRGRTFSCDVLGFSTAVAELPFLTPLGSLWWLLSSQTGSLAEALVVTGIRLTRLIQGRGRGDVDSTASSNAALSVKGARMRRCS